MSEPVIRESLTKASDSTDSVWLRHPGHYILNRQHDRYPTSFEPLTKPPDILFLRGNPDLLAQPMVAIVGSRQATRQGLAHAEYFASELSRVGFTIVSGLALGIDTAAHRGGLNGRGSTVAVMGTGADRIYPPQQISLAKKIEGCGLIVSEFALGTPPCAWHFPHRNRLIAALATGCLVVEAGLDSGSLITAQQALELGREVFALPGPIHSNLSKGCHRLIREGAHLVESPEEIIETLASQTKLPNLTGHLAQPPEPEGFSEPFHADLLRELRAGPATLDQLSRRCRLTMSEVSLMLTALELEGRVESLPGGRYQCLFVGG